MLGRSFPKSMSDPISRLQLAREEIDRVFGAGYAAAHPDVLAVTVQTAASDWAAARLAVATERVAQALLVDEEIIAHHRAGSRDAAGTTP